jgi:PhnB protein
MSQAKSIPDGVPVVIPMLVCKDAAAEMEFCKTTFGAVERNRRLGADGTVAHGLVTIGDAMIMIEGEFPALGSRAPQTDGSSSVVIYLYVEDVDQVAERAVKAGAKILIPLKNQFWGDRTGRIMDPSGHVWILSMRVEETSEKERSERWSEIKSPKS